MSGAAVCKPRVKIRSLPVASVLAFARALRFPGSELVLILISWFWVSACPRHRCGMARAWFSDLLHLLSPPRQTVSFLTTDQGCECTSASSFQGQRALHSHASEESQGETLCFGVPVRFNHMRSNTQSKDYMLKQSRSC